MKRFLTWILALPIGIVVVALAVANRHPVRLALDPLRPDDPLFAVSLPLFALILGALGLGVVIGGATVWWGQRRHRRAARVGRRETARLEGERARLAAAMASHDASSTPALMAVPPGSSRAA